MAVRSDEWQNGEEEDEEGEEEEEVVEGAETRFWIGQCMMTKEGEKKAEIKVFGVERCGRVQEWEVTKVD